MILAGILNAGHERSRRYREWDGAQIEKGLPDHGRMTPRHSKEFALISGDHHTEIHGGYAAHCQVRATIAVNISTVLATTGLEQRIL